MKIKFLTDAGLQRLTRDRDVHDALERYGPVAFFKMLPRSPEFKSLAKVRKNVYDLVEWGLDPVAASLALQADTGTHLSFADIVLAILIRENGAAPKWPATKDGWPADRPVDSVFTSSVDNMYCEQRKIPASAGSRPSSILFCTNDSITPEDMACPENRFLVYHGTSWLSALYIEMSANVYFNQGYALDFGPGFYVTRDLEFCKDWVSNPNQWRASSQPAILVFSVPVEYQQMCGYRYFHGQDWVDLLVKTRKHGQVELGTEDVFEGPMCTRVTAVDECREQPQPASPDQLCFRTRASVDLLQLEMAIFMKQKMD